MEMRRKKEIVLLISMPLTILGGDWFFQNKKEFWISLFILIEGIAFFLALYEDKKPRAREIVMIALLCALTVIGNLLSFSVLPVQAGTAMVMIAGMAFGPETGFLVGILSRLMVNFFQGQGPWTPWQMFCWGLLGCLAGICFYTEKKEKVPPGKQHFVWRFLACIAVAEAAGFLSYIFWPQKESTFLGWRVYLFGAVGFFFGLLFQKWKLPKEEWTMTSFTFLAVFIIYGGIMNFCTYLTGCTVTKNGMQLSVLRVFYSSGVPYDLWHAFRAAFFMLLFAPSILKKMERIKIKYGFYPREKRK